MNKRSRTSSQRCNTRRAITLVEVVASLALLGTLLGGAVMAKGSLTRQWSAAQLRVEAVKALDRQVSQWHEQSLGPAESPTAPVATFPGSGEGVLSNTPWTWRVETLAFENLEPLGIEVIRYTVWGEEHSEPLATIDTFVYAANESTSPTGVADTEVVYARQQEVAIR